MADLHIGIAGAGIMGHLLAWQLLRDGHKVTLFDRDPVESGSAAAYTAAGMLAPFSELESAETVIYSLGQRSLALWPSIIASLDAQALYHQHGSLVVAHPQDEAHLQQFNMTLQQKLPEGSFAMIDRTALRQREPMLAEQFGQATALPGESWVYTEALMQRLAQRIQQAGATWFSSCAVESVDAETVVTSDGSYHFDWVVDCRGLGAREQLNDLRGVRGEVIEVRAPDVSLRHMVRLMHPRYRLYLVPRQDHHYILGATQIESEDMSQISVRSALELLSALYTIHPGFGEARIVATRTNCRPALRDNLPAIRRQGRTLQVNGLFRHGYLLAPALVEQVQSLVGNETQGQVPAFPDILKAV